MLWKTHIRITEEVLHRLGMSESSAEAVQLREGVLAPDKWGDYPHHYGKSRAIQKYLVEARQFLLKGDIVNACFCLGVALHYVQDSYTSLSSRSPNHILWEQQIEKSYFVDDLKKTIRGVFQNQSYLAQKYLELYDALSREVVGKDDTLQIATLLGHTQPSTWGKPMVDLNLALKASFSIAKSVLGPKRYPKLEKDLKEVLAEHEELLREAEIVFADKIIELVKKRDGLKARKTYSGVSSKIKNWFLNIAIGIREYQANSKLQDYCRQRHLEKVVRKYDNTAEKISDPHVDWYEFEIPHINADIVENELLKIDEAIEAFRLDESILKDLIKTGRISCYNVRGKELLKRTEIKNCQG
jgi:hypothetical protein